MSRTVKHLIDLVYFGTMLGTVLLVIITYIVISGREHDIAKHDSITRVKSLLQAQLPAIALSIEQKDFTALNLRMQLLTATHRSRGLKVLIFDKNGATISNFGFHQPLEFLDKVSSQTDAGFSNDGFGWAIRPINVGLEKAGTALFAMNRQQNNVHLVDELFLGMLAVTGIAFSAFFSFIRIILQRKLILPMNRIVSSLGDAEDFVSGKSTQNPFDIDADRAGIKELVSLQDALLSFSERLRGSILEKTQLEAENAHNRATSEIASQVSHDIRSPLSALGMIVGSLEDLPEDKRLIIRNATQRINDIANQLLQKGKNRCSTSALRAETNSAAQTILLGALIDAIISEKRVQFRERTEVEIQCDLDKGYGFFVNINAAEFSRAISNLMNNAVEAISGSGRVTVAIRDAKDRASVIVSDNGKGIPPDILSRLGERGMTYGKEGTQSGSGLGVYQARKAIEQTGGEFAIQSRVGVGTLISLSLPKAEKPHWFVEKITIAFGAIFISVDDDQTVHQIWTRRLTSLGATAAEIKHFRFTSIDQFAAWVTANSEPIAMYFVDYEFLGQSATGLDVIERTGIGGQAILVTSRYDESQIQSRAESLGVRILPKFLAPSVPIEIVRLRADAIKH